jgi:predicted permease
VVRWLLRLLVPESEREFYLGDLAESGRRSWAKEVFSLLAFRLGRERTYGSRFRFEDVAGDVRLGVRRLLRARAATLTVLTALSLGIGMSALMFSLIDGALLPTLPFPDGDRIVRAHRVEQAPLSVEAFEWWSTRQTVFQGLGAWVDRTVDLAIEGVHGEPVLGAAITVTTLPLLSTQPSLGRGFTEADARPGASPVVLIGEGVWRHRLDASPDVLGRTVRLNGEPARIIGVMPEGFGFPMSHEVWTPLHLDALRPDGGPESLSVVGLLREGTSVETAAAELNGLEAERPREAGRPVPIPVVVKGFTDLINPAGGSRILAMVMMSVALLVLLVACANAANVLLAQAAVRSREVALRSALGAARVRIAAQFWIEVSLLALLGGFGGVVFAVVAVGLVRDAIPAGLAPFWFDLRIDVRVLAFVVTTALASAVLAGFLPAVLASRGDVRGSLQDSARGATSSRRVGRLIGRLVRAEMAVSFVLLVAAGLFIRSAVNVRRADLPFDARGVYTARVRLPDAQFPTAADRGALVARLDAALAGVPGARSVTVASVLPGFGAWRRPVVVDGVDAPGEPLSRETRYAVTTPGYLAAFGSTALSGRMYDVRDGADAPAVAVVNRSFERVHLPEGAVGRRIAFPSDSGEGEWVTIVGVVPDLLAGGLDRDLEEAVYRPMAQDPPATFQIAVRSGAVPETAVASIREVLGAVDPDIAIFDTNTMERSIRDANAVYAWLSALFLLGGALALFLAAIGLYGVMAFHVVHRTREIGLRMALGGERSTIIRLVMREGLGKIAAGLVVGVALAVPVAWVLRSVLLDVRPFDPLVFGGVLAVLVFAAWLGCLLPALQATRVDPQAALSAE